MLIREQPATDLTVATRILAHAGALAAEGRVVLRTGEVLYAAGAGTANHTMTPYDVTIVRLADGLELFGEPPADIARYREALLAQPAATAAALASDGTLVTAPELRAIVRALLHRPWDEAEAAAQAAGALIGAYPVG